MLGLFRVLELHDVAPPFGVCLNFAPLASWLARASGAGARIGVCGQLASHLRATGIRERGMTVAAAQRMRSAPWRSPLLGFPLALVLATATLSGVFGMAGGLLLMGGLALALPVSAAMVTHGAVQLVSNGWRAVIHRAHVRWRVIGFYLAGSVAATLLLTAVSYAPSKALMFFLLGLVPGLVWLPKGWIEADANKAPQAVLCGAAVTGLNLVAGVSGPLLDVFFVRTALTRHQIVVTKAATQVMSHLAKIIFYGAPFLTKGGAGMPPWWFFALAAPLAMLGAEIGGRILDRMTDKSSCATRNGSSPRSAPFIFCARLRSFSGAARCEAAPGHAGQPVRPA
jgi:uncharacterized membrane protein YfcA